MIVYVAGPMRSMPHDNAAGFQTAQRLLEEQGYEVISPYAWLKENGYSEASNYRALRLGLAANLSAVAANADAVVLLPGACGSRGAKVEMMTAKIVGVPVYPLDAFLLYGPEEMWQVELKDLREVDISVR